MKQTYNVGYLQTPSVKHLANVKQALADTGLASPTTPNEMLPTAIEEGVQVYKEKINSLIPDIEKKFANSIAFDENETMPTVFHITKDKKTMYTYKEGKLIYTDLTTKKEIIVQETNYSPYRFFESSDGSVYFTTNIKNSLGLYKLNKEKIKLIDFKGYPQPYALSTFYETSDNKIYFSYNNVYRIVNGEDLELVLASNQSKSNIGFIEHNNSVYFFAQEYDTVISLYYVENNITTKCVQTTLSWNNLQDYFKRQSYKKDANGVGYVLSGNGTMVVLNKLDSKVIYSPTMLSMPFYIDKYNNVYIVSSYKLLLIKNNEFFEFTNIQVSSGTVGLSNGELYGGFGSAEYQTYKFIGEEAIYIAEGGYLDITDDFIVIRNVNGLHMYKDGVVKNIATSNWNTMQMIKSSKTNNYYWYGNGQSKLAIYEGSEIEVIAAGNTLTKVGVNANGNLYFYNDNNNTLQPWGIEETEEGLVQKIYLGD